MAASTPAYTSLGYELPFPGSTILDNLEWSILYIADLTDTPYTYLKMGAVNAKLAHLYRTQPNATTQSIADVLTAKAANVETLDGYMGGPDVVREMVLWIDAFLPIAPQYEVHTGVIALFVLFAFISTVSTLARLASRFRTAHVVWSLKISDWFMILGTVLHLFIESMNIAYVVLFAQQHDGAIWNITYHSFKWSQIYATLDTSIYHACVLCLKSSLLVFYFQFHLDRTWRFWVLVGIFVINVMTNLAGFFFMVFECEPVNYWDYWLTSTCVADQATPNAVFGIVNIFTDVLLWLLPAQMIWSFARTVKRRVLSLMVVCSGAIACIASICRVWLIWTGDIEVDDGNMADFSIRVCTCIELTMMICCANVPAIRSLINQHHERKRSAYTARFGGADQSTLVGGTVTSYPGSGSGSGQQQGRTSPKKNTGWGHHSVTSLSQ